MLIECIDMQLFEFKITNYQFSRFLNSNEYDKNWLLIYLRVESKLGNWQTIDPCLMNLEVKRLIEWFESILNNEVVIDETIDFIEPNLSFHLIHSKGENIKKIKIEFDLEARPNNADDEIEYSIIFEAKNEKLNEIIIDLKNEIKKFPIR